MGCHLAENEPLKKLNRDLGLPMQCHSFRRGRAQGRVQPAGSVALGAPGAVLGYCQALFNRRAGAAEHSIFMAETLRDLGAPWWASHEIFWPHRGERAGDVFLAEALRPLLGSGRVPVVITPYDPLVDATSIADLVAIEPELAAGETILFRVALASEESIPATAKLLRRLLERARSQGQMPIWWPLIQSTFGASGWKKLRAALGADWPYANLAVNPFVDARSFEVMAEQVTVGQIPIGLAEGMTVDGDIRLAPGMKITGATEQARWNVPDYAMRLGKLETAPTLIILGPSQPEWTDAINRARMERFLPLLQSACSLIWDGLQPARQEMILSLSA